MLPHCLVPIRQCSKQAPEKISRLLQHSHPTKAIDASMEQSGMKGRGKWEIPGKTRRRTASYGMIPTRENPVTRPGMEPESPWWEAIKLTPRPTTDPSGNSASDVHWSAGFLGDLPFLPPLIITALPHTHLSRPRLTQGIISQCLNLWADLPWRSRLARHLSGPWVRIPDKAFKAYTLWIVGDWTTKVVLKMLGGSPESRTFWTSLRADAVAQREREREREREVNNQRRAPCPPHAVPCFGVQLVLKSFRESQVALSIGSWSTRGKWPLVTTIDRHEIPEAVRGLTRSARGAAVVNWPPVHNVCSVVVTPLESRRATSCGYNSSHPVWHALYECLQDIHGDSSPFLLQPFHELSNGFWPCLKSPHPAIQFVPKMFYRIEVGALGGSVQSANIVVGVPLHTLVASSNPSSRRSSLIIHPDPGIMPVHSLSVYTPPCLDPAPLCLCCDQPLCIEDDGTAVVKWLDYSPPTWANPPGIAIPRRVGVTAGFSYV
ncbi:hypothetical protein PR048_033634 [Dryococelus australis]|uniref:Uncharacterized protein n=1 Tax=Dryococelus australis TaxID=614101 RepID=A0ABQ9G0U3_9NEOP|nr:hypothetical protein PR048_033634 [Dryococelus australis]